jgi:predicted AAA+ superfamily ATPase
MMLDYANIANDLGVDYRTVQTYTHYLIDNLLLKNLSNYSSNIITKEKKLKKIYPSAPSLSLLTEMTGELFESIWVQSLQAQYFWRKNTYEVDIIVDR